MKKINVVIIGSGGREHALSWKLSQSPLAGTVYTIPGNAGIPNSVSIPSDNFSELQSFCSSNEVGLIVVGPEASLSKGIADYFKGTSIKVWGPDKSAARLESSKIFSKQFMLRNKVSTAKFIGLSKPYAQADIEDAIRYFGSDLVIKYDGLAAGKGVFVCRGLKEIFAAIDEIESKFGVEAPLVFEQLLTGPELSFIGMTDGKHIKLFSASQDHKRLLDGDAGPNTGGMGAYTPVKLCTDKIYRDVMTNIIEPTLQGLQQEKIDYKGFIYFGVLLHKNKPYLLEYNVRLGDPEAEVLLPALQSDLLEAILLALDGKLHEVDFTLRKEHFVDVVLCSKGYPGEFKKGYEISGVQNVPEDVLVFHSATNAEEGRLVTNGGRVLNVIGQGASFIEAKDAAYYACEYISFEGMYYRHDIGAKNV
jgi:phosphoribosylamine--glycine ligase